MSATPVLYVHRRNAKAVKSQLEAIRELDKRHRMVPSTSDAVVIHHHDSLHTTDQDVIHQDIKKGQCIAVPVSQSFIDDKLQEHKLVLQIIVAVGVQHCPYSTSMGNSNRDALSSKNNTKNTLSSNEVRLNDVQHALVETLVSHYSASIEKNEDSDMNVRSCRGMIVKSVLSLSHQTCPKKLEIMGDDRTLVLPRWSFFIFKLEDERTIADKRRGVLNEFRNLIIKCQFNMQYASGRLNQEEVSFVNIQSLLWEKLARTHRCSRVVRCGDIHPNSSVRESGRFLKSQLHPAVQNLTLTSSKNKGHRILWPRPNSYESGDINYGYIPSTTGKTSPGWITVTEHKISQSFDVTRVMFSRGNVTEKKRFAFLVQEGERVLDMYAGIGYYTLPALIHGNAYHVTACEWNPHALYALRYNLKANGVADRATVLEGDCRVSLWNFLDSNEYADECKQFDRVSLGLLPSSEGGWEIAVACLNRNSGGWLHIHGNVPTAERLHWAHWVCQSLKCLTETKRYSKEWLVVCTHVEKVKSFAPMVDHVVADVFLGSSKTFTICRNNFVCSGVVDSSGDFISTQLEKVSPPSCALSKDGVLHQKWLM